MFWPENDASALKTIETGELSTYTRWAEWKTSLELEFALSKSCKLSVISRVEFSAVLFLAYVARCCFNGVDPIKAQGLVSVLFYTCSGVRNQRDVLRHSGGFGRAGSHGQHQQSTAI